MNTIRTCKKCGFILGTRPGLLEQDGICQACLNIEDKKNIDFAARQQWLSQYLKECPNKGNYDCVV